jgi:hypothetical protein
LIRYLWECQKRKKAGLKRGEAKTGHLIIVTETSIFFIEAKLSSGNELKSSKNRKKYETGGKNWCSKVFRSDYAPVAIREKKYELMRLWLLGTWEQI